MNISNVKNRIWELDFLRGFALLCMIYFHMVFDLSFFYNFNINISSGFNFFIGRSSAVLFILIAGISCLISRNNLKRGLKILAVALVITIISHIYNPTVGIKFGILHFLSVSILLYPVFKKINRYILIILGIIVISFGYILMNINVSFDYLFPIGLHSNTFVSSDYYPLIPFLGVFLFGIALGKFLYTSRKSLIPIKFQDNIINMAGRNTLILYLVHQPIILILLAFISLFIKF
ncbi:MAG: heparan-alpha-glucosaminide N-acetyltransferase [Clostridia bacterium]|jgi:uncharacterized membrane protein